MPNLRVYLGTYTHDSSRGIYLAELDPDAGALSAARLAVESDNPSFVAPHPSGRCLYAVGEVGTFRGRKSGFVASFAIDPGTGDLSPLNRVASGGGAPCFVAVDPSGRAALVANYGGGSVAAMPIGDDGSLGEAASFHQHEGSGPDPQRQEGPHGHSILPEPTGRYALAADLGLDRVYVYRLDVEAAKLVPHDPPFAAVPPGAGPRHLAFHPGGGFLYVVNEMGGSVSAFAWDAGRGRLELLETLSTLPGGYTGKRSCAEVQIHPSGRYLYASNRGHDSIARFEIDPETGRLTPRGHTPSGGSEPRHFALDPSGRWLLAAHQKGGGVVLFGVDPETGSLEETGQRVDVSMPVCVRFV